MLTLKQLEARTDAGRIQRARYVKVVQMKTGYTRDGLGFVAAKTYSQYVVGPNGLLIKNPDPQRYVSMITFLNKRLHVIVSCSCADLLYMYEVANSYKDAAQIEYSNGEPPDERNPTYRPGLCKHLLQLYHKILPKLPAGR